MRIVLALFAVAFLAFSCTKENLKVADSVEAYSFSDIDLAQGISKWLNEEQKTRFSETELAELDALVAEEKLPVMIESRSVIEVPAESQDALALAIAEAGEGGTVILKAGNHFESSTVNIRQTVTIQGEAGAVSISDVQPTTAVSVIEPALHIENATNVVILGLMIQPAAEVGGTGILIENAERTFLVNNTLNNFEFGILVEQGDFARIVNNTVNTTPAWTTGVVPFAYGLTVINGDNTRVIGNTLTGALLGAWTCDESGLYLGNTTTTNVIGHILCNVPVGEFTLPDGRVVGSEKPGSDWLVIYNKSFANLDAGYLIIDGAVENYLVGNEAGNNGTYDFEFAGESERFGFSTPTSARNKAIISNKYTVKDCGIENDITGGIVIDTTIDPCY